MEYSQYKNNYSEEDKIRISVLIPVYMAGRYVYDAIESVSRQNVQCLELIIADDGSTDDSADHAKNALSGCARDIPSVMMIMPHRGQAAARNSALSLARGEWIFYLDADDMLTEGALQALLKSAEEEPEAGVICSMCRDFISPELSREEAAVLKINPLPYQRMLSGCTLIKRSVYDLVGNYNESLQSSETAEWMLRMKDAKVRVQNIDYITLKRRYHANNFGRRERKTQIESYMAIIKQRRSRGENKQQRP